MRLARAHAGGVEPLEAGESVGAAAPLELVEARQLGLARPRSPPCRSARARCRARRRRRTSASRPAAQSAALLRAGTIVEAGVNDAAVVAGLVRGEPVARPRAAGRSTPRSTASARAVARPTMPPPTTTTSGLLTKPDPRTAVASNALLHMARGDQGDYTRGSGGRHRRTVPPRRKEAHDVEEGQRTDADPEPDLPHPRGTPLRAGGGADAPLGDRRTGGDRRLDPDPRASSRAARTC